MLDEKHQYEETELIKKRIITKEGWFIPTLHEKYLKEKAVK
jgi:hypothetical protein